MSESPFHLLIAEDEFIIAMQLEERLRHLGYEVVGIASSGVEAVSMARRLVPDLILMDIVMPGSMDGIQAAEVITKESEIPVIFVTAFDDEAFLERAKAVQPLAYILKPFQSAQIKTAIEVAMHRKEMERKLRESERRYALAVQAANVWVWEWNMRTEEIHLDANLFAYLGYDSADAVKRLDEWLQWVHPEDTDRVLNEILAHVEGLSPAYESEYRVRNKDGGYRWLSSRGHVVRNSNERPSRLLGTLLDVTEAKKKEREREALVAELQEALNRVKRLRGLLPICCSCKRIRNDKGDWEDFEEYLLERSEASFSHGICPECRKKLYPDF